MNADTVDAWTSSRHVYEVLLPLRQLDVMTGCCLVDGFVREFYTAKTPIGDS